MDFLFALFSNHVCRNQAWYFLLPTLFPFVHAPTMVYSHTHKSQSVQIDNEEKVLLPLLYPKHPVPPELTAVRSLLYFL